MAEKGFTFGEDEVKRIVASVKAYEHAPKSTIGDRNPRRQNNPTKRWIVKVGEPRGFGKYDGTLITGPEQPITADSALTAADLGVPFTEVEAISVLVVNSVEADKDTNDVPADSYWGCDVLRWPTPTDRVLVVVINSGGGPLPLGQYQYMSYVMVSQNQAGFDYLRAHPILSED